MTVALVAPMTGLDWTPACITHLLDLGHDGGPGGPHDGAGLDASLYYPPS